MSEKCPWCGKPYQIVDDDVFALVPHDPEECRDSLQRQLADKAEESDSLSRMLAATTKVAMRRAQERDEIRDAAKELIDAMNRHIDPGMVGPYVWASAGKTVTRAKERLEKMLVGGADEDRRTRTLSEAAERAMVALGIKEEKRREEEARFHPALADETSETGTIVLTCNDCNVLMHGLRDRDELEGHLIPEALERYEELCNRIIDVGTGYAGGADMPDVPECCPYCGAGERLYKPEIPGFSYSCGTILNADGTPYHIETGCCLIQCDRVVEELQAAREVVELVRGYLDAIPPHPDLGETPLEAALRRYDEVRGGSQS